MRALTALSLSALLLAACGGSHSTAPSGRGASADSVNDAGQPVLDINVPTGTGNNFETEATQVGIDTDGTSFSAFYTVNLTYNDVTGYMNDSTTGQPAPQIDMWVSVVSSSDTVAPANVPLFYTSNGSYATDPAFSTIINGIEGSYTPVFVAFVGPNGQWDSNLGANYDIGIPHP